jgi:hypothetical protein
MEIRRGRLGRRLEFYTHPKYGGSVPIYLDAQGTFSAVIGDVVLKADTKPEILKLASETLKNRTNLEWIPVIQIEFGYRWGNSRNDRDERRNSTNEEVRLDFERFWIAQKIDKHWIESPWDKERYKFGEDPKIEIGDRLERAKQFRISGPYDRNSSRILPLVDFKLPHIEKEDDEDHMPKYIVAYTEELWATLQELSRRMQELQVKIVEVLKTPESRAQLAASLGKLLPAPRPELKKRR